MTALGALAGFAAFSFFAALSPVHVSTVCAGDANFGLHFTISPFNSAANSAALPRGNVSPLGRVATTGLSPTTSSSHAVRSHIVESRKLRTFHSESVISSRVASSPRP